MYNQINDFFANSWVVWHYFLLFIYSLYSSKLPEISCICEKDHVKEYYNQRYAYFKRSKKSNTNIDSDFYSKPNFDVRTKESGNDLEKLWKTRILMEYTPRGNIVMYYDVFRMGFAYFSDVKDISYDILNAVSMKYVVVFECMDFFMDETIVQDSELELSPLIKLHETDAKNKKENNDSNTQSNQHNAKDAPFAKFKNYSKKQSNSETNNGKIQTIARKNKFIYMGKLVNFFPCQQPLKQKSNLFQNFDITTYLYSSHEDVSTTNITQTIIHPEMNTQEQYNSDEPTHKINTNVASSYKSYKEYKQNLLQKEKMC